MGEVLGDGLTTKAVCGRGTHVCYVHIRFTYSGSLFFCCSYFCYAPVLDPQAEHTQLVWEAGISPRGSSSTQRTWCTLSAIPYVGVGERALVRARVPVTLCYGFGLVSLQ